MKCRHILYNTRQERCFPVDWIVGGSIITLIVNTYFIIPGADKSLARPGMKQGTDQTLTFASHSKKKSEICPSNGVSAAAITFTSEEKGRPSIVFFSRVGLRTYQQPCNRVWRPLLGLFGIGYILMCLLIKDTHSSLLPSKLVFKCVHILIRVWLPSFSVSTVNQSLTLFVEIPCR